MTKPVILLRNEYKPNEHRVALSPSDLKTLSEFYTFQVESSTTRIYSNQDYVDVGATIVPEGSWVSFNEPQGYVLGLKELPDPDQVMLAHLNDHVSTEEVKTPFALSQRHIMFAHCFKYQNDWKTTMSRFRDGKGELLDLEFLQWDNGRRVAAFGRAAGFAGMAVGFLSYVAQTLAGGKDFSLTLDWYRENDTLVNHVKDQLKQLDEIPTVLVLGALGRCGGGAVEMARLAGIPEDKIICWDLQETKAGGPFLELVEKPHILVNCIYVNGKMAPFIDEDLLNRADSKNTRKLSVFVDVSCEMSENNPFPINRAVTTFPQPLRRLREGTESNPPLDCCAIDHLPAMIPRQSSDDFSADLLETLKHLHKVDTTHDSSVISGHLTSDDQHAHERVWYRAKKLFQDKLTELSTVSQ